MLDKFESGKNRYEALLRGSKLLLVSVEVFRTWISVCSDRIF